MAHKRVVLEEDELCKQIRVMAATSTIAQMASATGVNPSTISLRLDRMGLRSAGRAGRKRGPAVTAECPACGVSFHLNISQKRNKKEGRRPCCSKECLRIRSREGALMGGRIFAEGPKHPNWKGGRCSRVTVGRIADYIVRYGDALTPVIIENVGPCTSSAVSAARRQVGIPPKSLGGKGPVIQHGYYTNTAKEVRKLIADINRFVKEGVN